MKKIAFLFVALASTTFATAQVAGQKIEPQINVAGEGKIKVTPDQAVITFGVENMGSDAADVKKKNDAAIDAIIKFLKKNNVPAADYQTKRVSLNRNYDYDKKKYSYVASQTIVLTLKDLSQYDALMMGAVDAGANNIQGVEFRTSKQAQYESEARVKAVQAARKKADDYTGALGQKLGKALVVTDNTQTYYPVAYRAMAKMEMASDMPKETLAIGEIEITANVNITYALE